MHLWSINLLHLCLQFDLLNCICFVFNSLSIDKFDMFELEVFLIHIQSFFTYAGFIVLKFVSDMFLVDCKAQPAPYAMSILSKHTCMCECTRQAYNLTLGPQAVQQSGRDNSATFFVMTWSFLIPINSFKWAYWSWESFDSLIYGWWTIQKPRRSSDHK